MRTKLTPLNILTAIFLVSIAYLLIFQDSSGWRKLGTVPLAVFALIAFISDMFFRIYVKDTKRIWIVELAFIIFAAVLVIIIQRI